MSQRIYGIDYNSTQNPPTQPLPGDIEIVGASEQNRETVTYQNLPENLTNCSNNNVNVYKIVEENSKRAHSTSGSSSACDHLVPSQHIYQPHDYPALSRPCGNVIHPTPNIRTYATFDIAFEQIGRVCEHCLKVECICEKLNREIESFVNLDYFRGRQ